MRLVNWSVKTSEYRNIATKAASRAYCAWLVDQLASIDKRSSEAKLRIGAGKDWEGTRGNEGVKRRTEEKFPRDSLCSSATDQRNAICSTADYLDAAGYRKIAKLGGSSAQRILFIRLTSYEVLNPLFEGYKQEEDWPVKSQDGTI